VDFIGQSKISIFGNDVIRTPVGSALVGNHNNIYIVDLADEHISMPYSETMKKSDVRTLSQGEQDILDNGDVFIEETDYARIMRLSPEQVVWEFTVKVDDNTLGMTGWSRYLTKSQASSIVSVLKGMKCTKKLK